MRACTGVIPSPSYLDDDPTRGFRRKSVSAKVIERRRSGRVGEGGAKREQKVGDEFEFGPCLVNFSPRVTALFGPGKKSVYCPQLETKTNDSALRVFYRAPTCAGDRASDPHNRGSSSVLVLMISI